MRSTKLILDYDLISMFNRVFACDVIIALQQLSNLVPKVYYGYGRLCNKMAAVARQYDALQTLYN